MATVLYELRNGLCFEEEERAQLQPLFLLLAGPFAEDDTYQEVRALIRVGIGTHLEGNPSPFSSRYRMAALRSKRLGELLENDLPSDQKKLSEWTDEEAAKELLLLLIPEVLDFTHEHLEEGTIDRLIKSLPHTGVRKILLSTEEISEPSLDKFKALKNSRGDPVEIACMAPQQCEDPGRQQPHWRVIKPGVNVQGVCKNIRCFDYMKRVWTRLEVTNNKKENLIGIIESIYCATCKEKKNSEKMKIDTVAFFSCYYQLESVVETRGRMRTLIKKSEVPPLGELSFFNDFNQSSVHYLNVVVDLLSDGVTVHARCEADKCAKKNESFTLSNGYINSSYHDLWVNLHCLSPTCNKRPSLEKLTLKNCSFSLEGKYNIQDKADQWTKISSQVSGHDLYPFPIKDQEWHFLNIVTKRFEQLGSNRI